MQVKAVPPSPKPIPLPIRLFSDALSYFILGMALFCVGSLFLALLLGGHTYGQ